MKNIETIKQRVGDLRALCGRYQITIRELTDEAGLNYDSVRINMNRLLLSDERMSALEDAAVKIRDTKKLQPQYSNISEKA